MKNFNLIRYKLTPQMREYDKMGHLWKPFVMHFNQPNIRSSVVNLDKFGLRYNNFEKLDNSKKVELSSIFDEAYSSKTKEKAVLIGASAAFGIGASSDNTTISNILSEKKDFHFLNMSCSAFSGFQETILFQSFINYINDTKQIIIFSGLNDIFLVNYLSTFDTTFGPHYFGKNYIKGMTENTIGWKKNIVKFILEPFLKQNINWNSVTKKELLKLFFEKKKNSKFENINKEEVLNNLIKKNFFYWSNIQKGMGIKIKYVLQPFANWCEKILSSEEIELFKSLDEASDKTHSTLKSVDKQVYINYKNLIEENCKFFNFDFIDCNKYIDNNNLDKKWFFVDRAHLTDFGNKQIAELIYSNL